MSFLVAISVFIVGTAITIRKTLRSSEGIANAAIHVAGTGPVRAKQRNLAHPLSGGSRRGHICRASARKRQRSDLKPRAEDTTAGAFAFAGEIDGFSGYTNQGLKTKRVD